EANLARGLGWFSLGLGVAEMVAPRGLARLIGLRGDHSNLFRMLGAREIASGIGLLTQRQPTAGAWSRVAGDAMDLALLGTAFTSPKANRGRLAAATAAVAGVTALDVLCSQQLSRRANTHTPGAAMRLTQSILINRSPEELYRFWRDFQNLPRFMKHLESVQVMDNNRSHWVAKGPVGTNIEWDAEIIEDRPNEVIAWRSVEGAMVESTGSVRFERAPGGRGTIVRVRMQYNPPGGVVGATVAKLLGKDPESQIKDDLRRFKQVMETGEVITTEGQPSGRSSSTSWRYDTAVRG
ncbi:MAG TPA: SRPBCC family protein, partial [Blastocatellia bacterium]|nr:SRPBCC family protein [Blastocatellia bacterium]